MSHTLYSLLRSPCCHKDLNLKGTSLSCSECSHLYKVINDIPVLLLPNKNKQLQQQEELFNDTYKQVKEYQLHNWQQSFINRLTESFSIGKSSDDNSYYIDIGAGMGYTVIEMAKKGVTAVGCDLSLEGMINAKKFAEKQGVGDNTLFVVADATILPFKDTSFNYASCIMLLEHLIDDKACISEISRIIKKRGRAFISVPNTYYLMWPFLWPLYMMWDKKLGHVRHYSEKHLSKLFISSKMKVKEIFYTVHLVKFAQLALSMILRGKMSNTVWWYLERLDLMQKRIKTGINLNAVFEK